MTLEKPRPLDLVLRSYDEAWTYERWLTLPDDGNRYEIIDGVLYMTTAPRFFHQWIIRQICLLLIEQIDHQGLGFTAWSPIGLLRPGCDPVQPDILVIHAKDRDMIYAGRIHGVPALIVEVLSSGNTATDLHIKRSAYARAGVPEYWIVRPVERDVIQLTQADLVQGSYLKETIVSGNTELVAITLPFRANVAEFFAGSPDETV